jgi:exosortase A
MVAISEVEQKNSPCLAITDKRLWVMFSALILAWAVVYQDALRAMEAIWSTSDTFAHGYFILPISLWLVWRDKENFLQSRIQPSWLALPLLVASLFVWLFAYSADINVLGQLSAVTSLVLLIWLIIGNKLAWCYKFPLMYLFFAVPMGENLIPLLQDVTAWFTVFFLKLNGIPVYVDGLYIQIPTGMFEVAVACSGIRYLIASVAVGTLFSYLTYNKTYKKILFVIFALTLPILANGIRAYGIVAIAYYSDMKYATGADHLIYGWLFFGLVIMLMFWVGGFFADKEQAKKRFDKELLGTTAQMKFSKYAVLPLLSLPLLVLTFFVLKSIPSVNLKEHNITSEASSSWGISFEDAYEKAYQRNEQGIEIFQAKYGNKQNKGELIVWQNVTHDYDRWTIVAKKKLVLNDKPVMLVHLRTIDGQPRSYLYQYKVGDFYTVSDIQAKLMQAWNSLSRQSDFSEMRAISLAGESDLTKVESDLVQAFNQYEFKGEISE